METIEDILDDGETHHKTWAPSIWIFLRRFVFVGVITSIVLGGVTYNFGFVTWITTTALAIGFYGFIFDDYTIWLERRHDKWALTNRRLLYIEDNDFHNALSVPLTDIAIIKQSFWGSILIQLTNQQKISMSYLADRKTALADISLAVTAASEPFEETL